MRVFFIGVCGTAMGNVAILLKEKGIDLPYEVVIYKIFEEKKHISIGRALVLKVYDSLISGHSTN